MANSSAISVSHDVKRLNVGCGKDIREGWINLDKVAHDGVDIAFDLEQCRTNRIPLPDNCIDEFLLSHVMQQITDTLAFMEELYRIAKPGAVCTIMVPHGSSDNSWAESTNVRPYFQNSFGYFSQPMYWRADYGYRGDWQTKSIGLYLPHQKYGHVPQSQLLHMIETDRDIVVEMTATLVAVKPCRAPLRELQVPFATELHLV